MSQVFKVPGVGNKNSRVFQAQGAGGAYSKFINDFESMATDFKSWKAKNPVGIPGQPSQSSTDMSVYSKAIRNATSPQSTSPGKDQSVKMSPELAKQYASYTKYASNPANKVENLNDPGDKGPSTLARIFDVLSRPAYAAASSFNALVDEAKRDGQGVSLKESLNIATYAIPGVAPIRGLIDAARGENNFDAYWRGISGKEKIFFSEVLENANPNMGSKTKAVTGLALDILTDPTTYLTGGVAGAGKAGLRIGGKNVVKSAVAKEGARTAQEASALAGTMATAIDNVGQDVVQAVMRQTLKKDGRWTTAQLDELRQLDLADPEVLVNTFFNPLPDRLIGSASSTAGREGRAAVARQQVQLTALLNALKPGLEASTKFDIYTQLINDGIKAGELVSGADMAQLAKRAFVIKTASRDQIVEYQMLLTKRARLQSARQANDGKLAPKAQAELDATIKKLDDLNNSADRFVVNIDEAGTMSNFVKNRIMNTKEYKTLKAMRDQSKPGSKAYEAGSKAMAEHVADRLIAQLGWHSDEIKGVAKAVTRASDKSLVARRAAQRRIIAESDAKLNDLKARLASRAARSKKSKTQGDVTEQQYYKNAAGETSAAKKAAEDRLKLIDEEIAHRANRAPDSNARLKKMADEDTAYGDGSLAESIAKGEVTPKARSGDVPDYNITRGVGIESWYEDFAKLESKNKAFEKNAMEVATREAKSQADSLEANIADFMARQAEAKGQKAFSVGVGWGKNKLNLITFTAPRMMNKVLEKAMSNSAIMKSVQSFQRTFVSSGRLGSEVKNIRAVMQNQGQSFIEARLTILNDIFKGLDSNGRKNVFQDLINNTPASVYDTQVIALRQHLDGLAEHFIARPGQVVPPLIWTDFMTYMPRELKAAFKGVKAPSIKSGDDLLTALREAATSSTGKALKDPAELFYRATVAAEQAQLKNLISHEIVTQFGLKVDVIGDQMANTLRNKFGYAGIEGFSRYNPIKGAGHTVLFDPEVAQQVAKLQDIFKSPQEFIQFFDKAQGVWKKTVTVWNPGFFSRSAMGDGFVSYLAGVSGPSGLAAYRDSGKILKAFNQLTGTRGLPQEAFQAGSMDMLANLAKIPDASAKAFRIGNKDFTLRDVWTLYVQHVGKTGFASTEFQHLAPQAGMRAGGVARTAQRVGDFGVNINQGREDYFRLAHFIWKLKQSKGLTEGNLQRFAQEAGEEVRKFHIDYSDFTFRERNVFARVAPFYKWTRKALPLMLEQTLINPAKISLFPKVMNSIGVAGGFPDSSVGGLGADASGQQAGGFNTRASDAIIPSWLSSTGKANPLMGGKNGTIFFGPAAPFNDVINTISSKNAIQQSTSPIIQAITGAEGIGASGNTVQQLAQLNPAANFIVNSRLSKGQGISLTDPSTINFLTGLGIQQNTEQRQSSELKYRTQTAKEKNKAKKNIVGYTPDPNRPPLDYRG